VSKETCTPVMQVSFLISVKRDLISVNRSDERTHPHRPRLVVSHSTCPPLSSSPPANSFVIGPAVINTHTHKSEVGHVPLDD
jgi:hypothetical protein